jgi:tetratricopeptide (TPR) repeat protein
LVNLAVMLASRGRLDEAAETLERAIAITDDGYQPERYMATQALRTLAFIRMQQGRVDEARRLAERRLELQRRLTPDAHALLADAIGSLATIEQAGGRHEQAARGYRSQLDMLRSLGQETGLAYRQALYNWSVTLVEVVGPVEAIARVEPEVERLVETLGPEHPSVITGKIRIATTRARIDPAAAIHELDALDALAFEDVELRGQLLLTLVETLVEVDVERARATSARLEALEGKGDVERVLVEYRSLAKDALAEEDRPGRRSDGGR